MKPFRICSKDYLEEIARENFEIGLKFLFDFEKRIKYTITNKR